MVLSNKTYDVLKWLAQYCLPALATFWMTIAKIWGLPYGVEIGATISAIDLFLGALMGISSANYKGDGTMTVNTDDPKKDIYSLELNDDIEKLAEKKAITFVVKTKE